MAEKKTNLVTVTVAPRKSIQQREKGMPAKIYKAGEQCQVEEWELERLFKQGFIVDPNARELTKEEIERADLSEYVPKSGQVQMTEKTDTKITQGRGSKSAA